MPIENYERIKVPAGAMLFSAGDAGSAAYLIEAGRLEIFLERDDGKLVLAQRRAGEIVGEMAILDRQPRSACVRALIDSTLVVITEESIARRMGEVDPVLKMCLGVVLSRYRETVAQLKSVENRDAAPEAPASASAPFAAALECLVLEREMQAGLQRGEFEFHFQPIVRLRDNALAGFEALMRWRHPVHGLVPPSRFIPLAETTGFITELTDWAIAEVARTLPACTAAAAARSQATAGPLFISVNISGRDLARAGFAEGVARALSDADLPQGSVKLEVTESVLMRDPEHAAAVLKACRAHGLGIAIDDFGTGYSSLSYLSTLPITTLKIDRAFVHAMRADPKSRKIVQTIIRLADELAIPVVAEGIERFAEAEMLNGMGCALGQGFLFGRPSPLVATLDVIGSWTASRPAPCRAVAC